MPSGSVILSSRASPRSSSVSRRPMRSTRSSRYTRAKRCSTAHRPGLIEEFQRGKQSRSGTPVMSCSIISTMLRAEVNRSWRPWISRGHADGAFIAQGLGASASKSCPSGKSVVPPGLSCSFQCPLLGARRGSFNVRHEGAKLSFASWKRTWLRVRLSVPTGLCSTEPGPSRPTP